jgi:hypothetical protein
MTQKTDVHLQQMQTLIEQFKAEGRLEKWPAAIAVLDELCNQHLYPDDPIRTLLEQIAHVMREAVAAKP